MDIYIYVSLQTSELHIGEALHWNGDPVEPDKEPHYHINLFRVNTSDRSTRLRLTCSLLPPEASCRWRSQYPGPA